MFINEFGEVGLDDLLVKPINDNTYLLSSDCMCCTMLTDLKDALLSLLDLDKEDLVFDKILIETIGFANPVSILSTLTQDMHLKGRFALHGMTNAIDAQYARAQATTAPKHLLAYMWHDDISRFVMIVCGLHLADIERLAKTVLHYLSKT